MADVREALDKDPNASAYAVDDGVINDLIPRASDEIDVICQHSFNNEVLTNQTRRGEQVVLAGDGVLEITAPKAIVNSISAASITADMKTWAALNVTLCDIDKYILRFYNVTAPIGRGSRMIARISYDGGYSVIPDRIIQATARLTAFMFMKRRAPFETTAFPQVGQVVIPSQLPPDVLELLQRDMRTRP